MCHEVHRNNVPQEVYETVPQPKTHSVIYYQMVLIWVGRKLTEFRFTHELVTAIANAMKGSSVLTCVYFMCPCSAFQLMIQHIMILTSYIPISVWRTLWFRKEEEDFWLTGIYVSMLKKEQSHQGGWRGLWVFALAQRLPCYWYIFL